MEISYHELTWKGLVRPKNEDFLGFRQPSDHEEWRTRGAISIICDGVGGQGNGDVASKMAVERALEAYAAAPRAADLAVAADVQRRQPRGLRCLAGKPQRQQADGHHHDRGAVPPSPGP